MELTRSGDVLANRYRLTDLLSEARDGRFWRAEDRILGRPVAIHVLDARDERAPRLAAAARASAAVNDARLLRVLDSASNDEIAYVVNEWGTGTSLDNLLAAEGPMSPRRAAWIAAEVTELLTKAHDLGHAHGRLNPENVLLDDLGAVRIIGFAVEAALYGHEPHPHDDVETDCVDAAALLYAALTGKWAGRTSSRVPAAPAAHGRTLRPRQVRAGVPRVLDDLCDDVLGRGAGGVPTPAREQHALLTSYVGDPAAVTTSTRGTFARTVLGTLPLGPESPASTGETTAHLPEGDDAPTQVTEPAAGPTEWSGSAPEPHPRPDVSATGEVGEATQAMAPPSAEEADETTEARTDGRTEDRPEEPPPTEAGLPVFDDDWTKPREDPAPPPPPFEPPAPKPLFADEPRRPREQPPTPPAPAAPAAPSPAASHFAPEPSGAQPGFWPWSGSQPRLDTGELEEPAEVPGRNWLRLAIGVAVAAVLVVCVALAYNATQGKGPFAGGSSDESDSPSPSRQTAAPAVVKGLTVKDFDPYGDPPDEYPDLINLVLDGDRATTWRTYTYKQQFGPGGLKPGLGFILDLKSTYAVGSVHLDLVGEPTGVSIYVGDEAPTEAPTGTPAAKASLGTSGDITLKGSPKGRFVTVWLTSLPAISGGYRGEVSEVSVTGSKVSS